MDIYKEFIYNIKSLEYEIPHLTITDKNPEFYLSRFMKMLVDVPIELDSHNVYYGEIKKIINAFLNCIVTCMNHVCKNAECYTQRFEYDEMLELFEKTLQIQESNHHKVLHELLPIESQEEQKMYNLLETQFIKFKDKLIEMREEIAAWNENPNEVKRFAKNHFQVCVERSYKVCDFSHLFVTKLLTDRIPHIRTSLQNMVDHVQSNLRKCHKDYHDGLMALHNELYDLNKQKLAIMRRNSGINGSNKLADIVEINHLIDKAKSKIINYKNQTYFEPLNREFKYWTGRLKDLENVVAPINKIKNELDQRIADEKDFRKLKSAKIVSWEPPGSKTTCWDVIGEKFMESKKDLEQKYTEACRALVTFFAVKGVDHSLTTDNVGSYFVDEYGHQNYITNYGANYYHVNCSGTYVEPTDYKYYFDENGRYILEDGQKLYQTAPCTNTHTLGEDGRLHRTNKMCSCAVKLCDHSYELKEPMVCRVDVKDLSSKEILPKEEIINIEKTMDSETVRYLWDSVGWILPEILNEVLNAKSKNPIIHTLGHLLLKKKYNMTRQEIRTKKAEADKYRTGLLQERKEQIEAGARAWKTKFPKSATMEDLDTTPQDMTYRDHMHRQQEAVDLSSFYNEQ